MSSEPLTTPADTPPIEAPIADAAEKGLLMAVLLMVLLGTMAMIFIS